MCVWQSHAPAGMSKFTLVAGWAALARASRLCMAAPAARAPIRVSRRVSIASSQMIWWPDDLMSGVLQSVFDRPHDLVRHRLDRRWPDRGDLAVAVDQVFVGIPALHAG